MEELRFVTESRRAKAFYRQGVAYRGLGDLDKAIAALKRGLHHDEESDRIRNELLDCEKVCLSGMVALQYGLLSMN